MFDSDWLPCVEGFALFLSNESRNDDTRLLSSLLSHRRLFVLHIGLPLLIDHLPRLHLSHFAVYCLAIRYLHSPRNDDEITFAERLLHLYCQTASDIFGPSIELLTLHVHLHLPRQVRMHGGLAFTSAFAFESAIRYTKKKAHGTRCLASQISYWTDVETIIQRSPVTINKPCLLNQIDENNPAVNEFQVPLLYLLNRHGHLQERVALFKRYKQTFVTYHSYVYDKGIRCASHIVSYSTNGKDDERQVAYGDCIVFYRHESDYFVLLRKYSPVSSGERFSTFVDLPDAENRKIHDALDRTFSMQTQSDSFIVIPVGWIRHKCVSVAVRSFVCLSEIRVDFEHD